MSATSFSSGMTPASESLVALTMIMNRISYLLVSRKSFGFGVVCVLDIFST